MASRPFFAMPAAVACAVFIVAFIANWASCSAAGERGGYRWRADDLDCTLYFPPSWSGGNRAAIGRFEACLFSSQLDAMKEPSLRFQAKDIEAYRFTWLRSFENPVAVRIERRGDERKIVSIELDGVGGGESSKVLQRRELGLTPAQWGVLVRAVDETRLWADRGAPPRVAGADGAEWILEGTREGEYRVIREWSPRSADHPHFVDACMKMLAASGLTLPGQDAGD